MIVNYIRNHSFTNESDKLYELQCEANEIQCDICKCKPNEFSKCLYNAIKYSYKHVS